MLEEVKASKRKGKTPFPINTDRHKLYWCYRWCKCIKKEKTSNLTTRPHQSLKIYTDSSGPEFPEQPCHPEVSNSTSQCANAPTFAKLIKAG
ncbi:hypothetical protein OsJ_08333 [Oryza sativa Japonica Group]|uniref:Uncharacterized protein n=1 Tax=Oryza sativa subsp. japonica TaxID=39947 RepID=B9F2X7_ORYSJ|nr:hypothetical protein OsJ_08333 [Oryza sativa Japonica Group]